MNPLARWVGSRKKTGGRLEQVNLKQYAMKKLESGRYITRNNGLQDSRRFVVSP